MKVSPDALAGQSSRVPGIVESTGAEVVGVAELTLEDLRHLRGVRQPVLPDGAGAIAIADLEVIPTDSGPVVATAPLDDDAAAAVRETEASV